MTFALVAASSVLSVLLTPLLGQRVSTATCSAVTSGPSHYPMEK